MSCLYRATNLSPLSWSTPQFHFPIQRTRWNTTLTLNSFTEILQSLQGWLLDYNLKQTKQETRNHKGNFVKDQKPLVKTGLKLLSTTITLLTPIFAFQLSNLGNLLLACGDPLVNALKVKLSMYNVST